MNAKPNVVFTLLCTLPALISCFSGVNNRQKFARHFSGEDRQAQAPSFATHNFEELYRATAKESTSESGAGSGARKPNIIFILTDDQDTELGSMKFMPKVAKHLSNQGATFSQGFSSTPMCCPSRSSILTGLYVHNHAVYTNNDNCSSSYWVKEHEPRTFATYLQDSGYSTAYFGKYLNKYTGSHVPAGWGEWQGLVRNSRFYNYTLNVNGALHHHGFNYEKDYLPDVITNRSMNFLRWSLTTSPDSPVLATLSYPGPHGPEDSAPQYKDLFFNVTTHHTPAYDLAPNPDKQWILRETGKMAPIQRRFTDMLMTKRLQTLQSIDDGVEKVVQLLEELGQLDNTYIIYTSDHGYHLGQYGLVKGKAFPFDVDTKVPWIMRGPGIPRNSQYPQPVVNIDLAPTFLDAAGLTPPPHMDGRSLLDVFRKEGKKNTEVKPWRSAFLIERGKMTFERYMKVSSMANSTLLLKNQLTKRERVEIECKKPRYQLPCSEEQKWFCKERKSDGVMKMRKCPSPDNKCQCSSGDVIGWKYAKTALKDVTNRRHRKLAPKERSDQKDFLRKHVNQADKIKARFLKEVLDEDLERDELKDDFEDFPATAGSLKSLRRWKRGTVNSDGLDLHRWQRESEEGSLEGMLDDVADQEILEVDGMVEDLAAEIRSLHKFTNSSIDNDNILGMEDDLQSNDDPDANKDDNCLLNRNNVLCSAQDFSKSELSWEKSRLAVKHQIQRLRAQLHELKQIRRYLHVRRPAKKHHNKPRYHNHLRSMHYPTLTTTTPFPAISATHGEDAALGAFSTGDEDDFATELCTCTPGSTALDGVAGGDLVLLRQQQLQRRRQKKLEKLRRKTAKREKMERKLARKMNPRKADHCKADVKMNCFSHDNDHWKTAPLWTEGPFCACTNSNNNTYWCVRNINTTHNYLYCEYVTGMVTYFDLSVDPHQLRNLLHTLGDDEINYMHSQVNDLREYSAANDFRKFAATSKTSEKPLSSVRSGYQRSILASNLATSDFIRSSGDHQWTDAETTIQDSKADKQLRKSLRRQNRQRSKKQLKKQQQLKKRIHNLLKIHKTAANPIDMDNNHNGPSAMHLSAENRGNGGNINAGTIRRMQRKLLRGEQRRNRRRNGN